MRNVLQEVIDPPLEIIYISRLRVWGRTCYYVYQINLCRYHPQNCCPPHSIFKVVRIEIVGKKIFREYNLASSPYPSRPPPEYVVPQTLYSSPRPPPTYPLVPEKKLIVELTSSHLTLSSYFFGNCEEGGGGGEGGVIYLTL